MLFYSVFECRTTQYLLLSAKADRSSVAIPAGVSAVPAHSRLSPAKLQRSRALVIAALVQSSFLFSAWVVYLATLMKANAASFPSAESGRSGDAILVASAPEYGFALCCGSFVLSLFAIASAVLTGSLLHQGREKLAAAISAPSSTTTTGIV